MIRLCRINAAQDVAKMLSHRHSALHDRADDLVECENKKTVKKNWTKESWKRYEPFTLQKNDNADPTET